MLQWSRAAAWILILPPMAVHVHLLHLVWGVFSQKETFLFDSLADYIIQY